MKTLAAIDCVRLTACSTFAVDAVKKEPFPGGPKSIPKVFAARHLSKNGQASYGHASFGFQDIMFVDIDVFLRNSKHSTNRTLVIQGKDGEWYAHPMPTVGSGLLAKGLNDTKASEKDFSNAYEIQK